MSNNRLVDYIGHPQGASADACAFVQGMSKEAFVGDRRTQNAVVMSLVIVGEAAAKILEQHSSFADRHREIAWRSMRGMRNRIAHGYFDINLDVAWETVRTALPEHLAKLPGVLLDTDGEGFDTAT